MPDAPPIGGGYYAQFFTFGIAGGAGTGGGWGATVYTQVGAGVGAAGGASFSSTGVTPYAAVGFASVTGSPGAAWSALYDFPSGHVFFSEGAGISDFLEVGIYQEFPTWNDFKHWFDENFPDEPELPAAPPSKGELGQPSTGLLEPVPPPGIPGSPPLPRDPLIFDLLGTGIELEGLESSHAYFDYGGDGFAEKSGWIKSGQGILVSDPGSSNIVTAANVIGAVSGDGFGDLADYDVNHDGLIDINDPSFTTLKMWIDSDGNGSSSQGELHTLSEIGITRINIQSLSTIEKSNGNTIIATSSFTMIDPTTQQAVEREIAQVDFLTNTQISHQTLPENMTYTGRAIAIPQIVGYGLLADFRVAASLDSELAESAKQLVLDSAMLSATDFKSQFESLLEEWAGTENIDPSSAGGHIDARHLAFVYKYYGINPSIQTAYPTRPNAATANLYEGIYQKIVASMEARFISQIPSALWRFGIDAATINEHPLMPFVLVQYDAGADRLNVDFNVLITALKANEPAVATEKPGYWDRVLPALSNFSLDFFDGDRDSFLEKFLGAAMRVGYPPEVVTQLAHIFRSDVSLANVDTDGNLKGTPGTDIVYGNDSAGNHFGYAGDDFIAGGRGDDSLYGGGGNDTYYYSRGDGNDTITEDAWNGSDRLVFTDINPADISLSYTGTDLTITIAESSPGAGDGGSVKLVGTLIDAYG
ncbi:hypothetical protein J2X71_006436, partial [Rhizobium sp. 1399]|nr:hypothetical protein [Rhizobium sp. 1399]